MILNDTKIANKPFTSLCMDKAHRAFKHDFYSLFFIKLIIIQRLNNLARYCMNHFSISFLAFLCFKNDKYDASSFIKCYAIMQQL